MPAPTLTAAYQLAADISSVLHTAEMGHEFLVTLDGRELQDHIVIRGVGVLVQAPTMVWPSWDPESDRTWSVIIAAGPADDYLRAWTKIDTTLDALTHSDLAITEAEPASFEPITGPVIPAYKITLKGDH